MKKEPRYEVMNGRPKHNAKELIEHPVEVIDDVTQVRPATSDAVTQDLREAIKVREHRAKLRREHNGRSA